VITDVDSKLLRVGVFYDGNFFSKVSTYYRYFHPRNRRISISGLHEFIRHHVAEVENMDVRYCQIVDAHFFRGRFSAKEADARQMLLDERSFDDVLMNEGVVTHYLPIIKREKGIDVWLALEAFELAIYKRFNVLVLIAGDSDFIPLARKINSLGTRIMVLGWDFKYTDRQGQEKTTITSINLLQEVTYPVMMHQIIDDKTMRDNTKIRNLFVEFKSDKTIDVHHVSTNQQRQTAVLAAEQPTLQAQNLEPKSQTIHESESAEMYQASVNTQRYDGIIVNLKAGFGFIKSASFPNNVFFHWSSMSNVDFSVLQEQQHVRFSAEQGDRGMIAHDVEAF